MAINYVKSVISSGYNLEKLNNEFAKIKTALEDGLSRSGNGPNQMSSDLDMNGYNILNVDLGGASGSFTSTDGKTITVVGGVITGIV